MDGLVFTGLVQVHVGRHYPNGLSRSALIERFLTHTDLGCTPWVYESDLSAVRGLEEAGVPACHWGLDTWGRTIVIDCLLATDLMVIEVLPDRFRFAPARPKPQIFISYAKEDVVAARRVYRALTRFGASPWLDERSLLGGQHWRGRIEAAVRSSSHFVALLSRTSVGKRGTVQAELRQALKVHEDMPYGRTFIVPARLDDCEVAHPAIRELHIVDLSKSFARGIRDLARAVGLEA